MLELGVNIDHTATIRQARLGLEPSPLQAALLCEKAGADGITAHLREDRRHIQDHDMAELKASVRRLNMEMAVTDEMVRIASEVIRPAHACLVPEKRAELTTEGGLDAAGMLGKLKEVVPVLHGSGVIVSLFIDPDKRQIDAASSCGAEFIELHTGTYANAKSARERLGALEALIDGASYAHSLGLRVNAGHGIDYRNIGDMLEVPFLHELNIGHSIISRAIFVGLCQAVEEMRSLMSIYCKQEG